MPLLWQGDKKRVKAWGKRVWGGGEPNNPLGGGVRTRIRLRRTGGGGLLPSGRTGGSQNNPLGGSYTAARVQESGVGKWALVKKSKAIAGIERRRAHDGSLTLVIGGRLEV